MWHDAVYFFEYKSLQFHQPILFILCHLSKPKESLFLSLIYQIHHLLVRFNANLTSGSLKTSISFRKPLYHTIGRTHHKQTGQSCLRYNQRYNDVKNSCDHQDALTRHCVSRVNQQSLNMNIKQYPEAV